MFKFVAMDYVSKFLEHLQYEKNYAAHTLTAYRTDLSAFQHFLSETYQDVPIEACSYAMIRSWIVDLVEKDLNKRTINRKLTSLKVFFNFLLKIEAIRKNPMATHKSLKTQQKQELAFSQTEVKGVFELFDRSTLIGQRDQLIVELLYATGMRRQELINLKTVDIGFSQKSLKVLGKRNKERLIPVSEVLLSKISAYLKFQEEETETVSSYLIQTQKGQQAYPNLIYRVVRSYFNAVSVKQKCSPHMIRHSFATHLLQKGADLVAIKELMGHDSLASTQHYTKNNLVELRQVVRNKHPRSVGKIKNKKD